MKLLASVFFTVLLFWSGTGYSQVNTNFNNPTPVTEKGKFNQNFTPTRPYVIPARDIKALQESEASQGQTAGAKPFQIAEPVSVNIDVVKQAVWTEDDVYAYGKFTILATGARSVSINFDQFRLPAGTELYVYSQNGEMITGPITEQENNERNEWGSWVYKGSMITVDFKCPIGMKEALDLHISNVAYGYKDLYITEVDNFGQSSSCNINVLCPLGSGWEKERNSVALILNQNGTALCTGALINNACNQNIPYFLTANHCFQSGAEVVNWRFTFQAWSSSCSPSQNANGITFNGSTLRANNAGSDFALLELKQVPPPQSGLTYAGWSRNTTNIQQTTIIHHPAGDVMKISRDNEPPSFSTFLGAQTWHLVLDQGATNGGSSGAPYFDQNHRIIGQHYGVYQNYTDQCLNTDKFAGRFDISWTGGGTNATRLSNWLDPFNTGAMTTDTRGIYYITASNDSYGADYVLCGNGATFSLQNLLPGSTVSWSSSNTSGLSINAATGVATVQNNYVGKVVLTASITAGACGNVLVTRNVIVGSPAPNVSVVEFPVYKKPSRYDYTATLYPGATYEWYVNGALQASSNTNTFSTYISCGVTKTVKCVQVNACGASAYSNSISITGECLTEWSVYPNPSSTEMYVTLSQDPAQQEELDADTEIVLLNSHQMKVYTQKTRKTINRIPIGNLPEGFYYLGVANKEGITYKRVLIKR